ncbi:MAG: hypothetical protein GXP04_09240 [Alphaproteobacteria bacterium]|nr:hypothetical protein [Alphaproteobacteria bacterium]
MAKTELPEGITPDNNSRSSMSDGEFLAPDMATPHYSHSLRKFMPRIDDAVANTATHRAAQDEYDEDDDEVMSVRSRPASTQGSSNFLMIVIFIIAVFAMGAGVFMIKNQNTLPLCSSQPDWNQFNCRAG